MAPPAGTARTPIITLTTDFGEKDSYVASLKGAILSITPEAHIVDITHHIPPQGITEGGFVLSCALPDFPPGTIHILVVDPEVGTSRRLLLARTEKHIFLAPDNGALGIVFDREPPSEVFVLTASHYFRTSSGATFQGRDILAPVAAWIARGTSLSNFGKPITDWTSSSLPKPLPLPDGRVRLQVVHVDRFGNVILNLREGPFAELRGGSSVGSFSLELGSGRITSLRKTYAEETSGGPFALFNSAGYLEVAVRNGSAAAALGTTPGQHAFLRPGSGSPTRP